MKLIKTFDGKYINPRFIESYAVNEHKTSCDVVAYKLRRQLDRIESEGES